MPAVAAALPGVLINVGIGLAANAAIGFVSNAIAGPQDPAAGTKGGMELEPRAGIDVTVSAIMGEHPTAGTYWYQNSYGTDNEYLQLVYVCGRGEHHSLTGLYRDGRAETLSGSNGDAKGRVIEGLRIDANGNPDAGGTPYGWIKYYTGAAGQTADAELVARANPSGRWPNTKKMTATAYVIITLRNHDKLFPGTLPRWGFVWKGLKFYDRRKDSTQPGGSGAHRWGTPSTYEWTDNPAILQDNWRRGIWVNGVRLLGLGVSESAVHHNRTVAAANVCDESVVYADTGRTLPRYTMGTEVADDDDPVRVMRMFELAMAGNGAEFGGAYAPLPGQTQIAVMTLTDSDRASGEDVSERTRLDPTETKTAFNGVFTSRSDGWVGREYGLRFDATVESDEGGRRQGKLDLGFINQQETAGAIAEIMRRRDRYSATETAVYGPKTLKLEPGDVVTRESELLGTVPMMVWGIKELSKAKRQLTFRAWNNAIVPSTTAGFLPLPATPVQAPVPSRPITVSAFLLAAVSQASGPHTVPALRATWTPITDKTVDRVIIRYWPTAAPTQVRYQNVDDPGAGSTVIEGVLPETAYSAEATIVTTPPRPTIWCTVSSATTGRLIVGDIAPDAVSLATLAGEVRGALSSFAETTRALIEQAQEWATIGAGETLANFDEHAQIRREAQILKEDVTLRYLEAITLATGPSSSIVSRLEQLEVFKTATDGALLAYSGALDVLDSRIDTNDGQLTAQANAITQATAGTVGGDVLSATSRMSVVTGIAGYSGVGWEVKNGTWRTARFQMLAPNNPALPTEIRMDAQSFILGDFSSGAVINPLVYVGGVWKMNVAHIGAVSAGTLSSLSGNSFWNLSTGAFRIATS